MVKYSEPVALILMNVLMVKMSVVLMQPVKILNHRTLANVLKDIVLILKSKKQFRPKTLKNCILNFDKALLKMVSVVKTLMNAQPLARI